MHTPRLWRRPTANLWRAETAELACPNRHSGSAPSRRSYLSAGKTESDFELPVVQTVPFRLFYKYLRKYESYMNQPLG